MKEERAADINLIDTSIWFSYLVEGYNKETIDDEEMFYLSILSLFEIEKKLLEKKIPQN